MNNNHPYRTKAEILEDFQQFDDMILSSNNRTYVPFIKALLAVILVYGGIIVLLFLLQYITFAIMNVSFLPGCIFILLIMLYFKGIKKYSSFIAY